LLSNKRKFKLVIPRFNQTRLRAFKVAGAKTIITSLWKVSDEATQELMTAFYENWLATQDKQQAFSLAQKKLMAKYKSPYFRGAFVMIGE
jgi:CHAT domain-containing protein